jgi:putative Holliday junction resolvase
VAILTRLLGVDFGESRIGLAVADTADGSIKPLATIRRGALGRDAATLATVCAEQRVDEIVVGLPLNMDGTEGAQAASAREWVDAIAPAVGRPFAWHDERLSSVIAEKRIGRPARGRAGGPPSPAARNTRRARLDREAAAQILQAELDSRTSDERTL